MHNSLFLGRLFGILFQLYIQPYRMWSNIFDNNFVAFIKKTIFEAIFEFRILAHRVSTQYTPPGFGTPSPDTYRVYVYTRTALLHKKLTYISVFMLLVFSWPSIKMTLFWHKVDSCYTQINQHFKCLIQKSSDERKLRNKIPCRHLFCKYTCLV